MAQQKIFTAQISNLPIASEVTPGLVELATVSEATTGTDTSRAVTAAGVAAVIAAMSGTTTPLPQAGVGVGQWVTLLGPEVPSGGTWAYFLVGNLFTSAGIAAGGTGTLGGNSSGAGFAWRIT